MSSFFKFIMGKSKKNRQKDFQKVKLKVGRRLKKGDNVTNASFKTRTVQVSQQLKTGQVSGPSTKKKQNVAVRNPWLDIAIKHGFHALMVAKFRGRCYKPRPKSEIFVIFRGTWLTLMFDQYYCIHSMSDIFT